MVILYLNSGAKERPGIKNPSKTLTKTSPIFLGETASIVKFLSSPKERRRIYRCLRLKLRQPKASCQVFLIIILAYI
jgi:hypothetical protein